jgi:hypothetical protein
MKMSISLPVLLIILCVWLCGCSTSGYITSAISTVVGLDVSENPKTQMPHVRFGYVRGQYYYIPTDKVAGGTSGESASSKQTPELVSNLFLKSDFLSSTTISEQFAVGEVAVRTTAAQNAFGAAAPTQALAQSQSPNAVSYLPQIVQQPVRTFTRRPVRESTEPPHPLPTPGTAEIEKERVQITAAINDKTKSLDQLNTFCEQAALKPPIVPQVGTDEDKLDDAKGQVMGQVMNIEKPEIMKKASSAAKNVFGG